MDRLAFTAAAAVNEKKIARQLITNELANVATVGFKRSFDVAMKSIKIDGQGFDTRFQPQAVPEERVLLTPGTLMATGRKSDIAMNNATVLGVQAPNGETAFTRRGDLRLSATGVLETGSGHPVQGLGGGPITVPPGFEFSISTDGSVFARDPAAGANEPAVLLDQLLLRDASETPLIRRPDGLFERPVGPGDFATGPSPVSVTPEALEGSNVNPVEVMTRLIDHSRSFEFQMKAIKEARSIDENGASMMRAS
jgi:flagellar basal-body rod protein FlgF